MNANQPCVLLATDDDRRNTAQLIFQRYHSSGKLLITRATDRDADMTITIAPLVDGGWYIFSNVNGLITYFSNATRIHKAHQTAQSFGRAAGVGRYANKYGTRVQILQVCLKGQTQSWSLPFTHT